MTAQQNLKVEKQTTYTEADLRQTLAYLSELLKDQGVIASMWPESADESDMALYNNLSIKIDQHNSKVEIFTAATNFKGTPVRISGFDLTQELNYIRTPPPAQIQQAIPE